MKRSAGLVLVLAPFYCLLVQILEVLLGKELSAGWEVVGGILIGLGASMLLDED